MTSACARIANGTLHPGQLVRIAAENMTPTAEETPLVAEHEVPIVELIELSDLPFEAICAFYKEDQEGADAAPSH